MATQVSLSAGAQTMLANSGMSQSGIDALTTAAANSPYFAGMLNDAASKNISIVLGTPTKGTFYSLDGNRGIIIGDRPRFYKKYKQLNDECIFFDKINCGLSPISPISPYGVDKRVTSGIDTL